MNVTKAVLPGLWQLLGGGGHGSARLVYPCLPPLLATLVQQVRHTTATTLASVVGRLCMFWHSCEFKILYMYIDGECLELRLPYILHV